MDNMREEFEKWLSHYMPSYELEYSGHIEDMFEAWQASRQALVVEFTTSAYFAPYKTELELASDEGFNSAMNDVKAALDAAGISYK